jgi:peptidoglycan L-alanyl-D-glutamate endopeptidase CwlK
LPRQKQLLAQGATRTLNSRHLTGHAVDLAPMIGGTVSWDWPTYYRLAKIVKAAAEHEDVPITWGGDWENFKDGPHWELPWKQYPKGE